MNSEASPGPRFRSKLRGIYRERLNKFAQRIALCLALLLMYPFQSCNYYYKVQTISKVTPHEIHKYDSLNKYFIIHQGDSAWHLDRLAVRDTSVSGEAGVLPDYRYMFLRTNPDGGNRYKNTKNHYQGYVLEEVHLYLQDKLTAGLRAGDNITLDYSAFRKAEVYVQAKGRTTASWVIPAVAPIVIVGGIIAIAALTKSSCPLVYLKKGNNYDFAGEIFGGAVYSSLERHDYLPLPEFRPSKNKYELVISNGLPEVQYINLAELWIVNHPANISVLPDRHGVIHSISKPWAPLQAQTSGNSNVLALVSKKDKDCFHFDEEPAATQDSCAINKVFLTFSVPAGADHGKLVIRAGNSMWGDYTYGEFTKLFGNKYGDWIRKQGKEPREKNAGWIVDQRFALLAYVETGTGWQFMDYFDMIGPLGARDLIMPVDLSKVFVPESTEQNRTIRIRLESGYKFWDLDYAAMDFSNDAVFKVNYVQPSSAITESDIDVSQSLGKDDAQYYIQENTGERGLVVFQDSPDVHGMRKSVFLHTKGYYEHVRNYPGPPDKKQLQTFLVPGRFSRFSYDYNVLFRKNNWAFTSEKNLP